MSDDEVSQMSSEEQAMMEEWKNTSIEAIHADESTDLECID